MRRYSFITLILLSLYAHVGLILFMPQAFPSSHHYGTDDWAQVSSHPPGLDLEQLAPYQLVFIPGIWSDYYTDQFSQSHLLRKFVLSRLPRSFDDQYHWYRALGVDTRVLPITSKSCEVNAAYLRDQIMLSPKKAILVVHSKGGLDILHALVRYPELRSRVAGLVTMQVPFRGSPLAATLVSPRLLGRTLGLLLDATLGNVSSLSCASPEYLEDFFSAHSTTIDELRRSFPIVSFASWRIPFTPLTFLSPPSLNQLINFGGSLFEPLLYWLSLHSSSKRSDGLVPLESMCFPDAPCYVTRHLDHAAPVMDLLPFASWGKANRINLTRSLVQEVITRNKLQQTANKFSLQKVSLPGRFVPVPAPTASPH